VLKKVVIVSGARPNFVKIAPIVDEMKRYDDISVVLVHTGQHYDSNMSGEFFALFGLDDPDYEMNVGSGSHAEQTAKIMTRFEKVCVTERPDMVIVVGDVNSTLAASLVAKKLGIPVAHVEAGLRSKDHSMPEEINRIVTDSISDILFTTEQQATKNLLAEGHSACSIHFVGHVMIDTLIIQRDKLERSKISEYVRDFKEASDRYACLTLHRPSNVDDSVTFRRIMDAIEIISRNIPIAFPCHPRTLNSLRRLKNEWNYLDMSKEKKIRIENGIFLSEPLRYDDFLFLWKDADFVLTDSGGLQEETTAFGVPCFTLRENTERPITVEIGTNIVVGTDGENIIKSVDALLRGELKKGGVPPLWDGRASERIVKVIRSELGYEAKAIDPDSAVIG